jgi:hypothetical protein
MTDEVNHYTQQEVIMSHYDPFFREPIGDIKNITKQVSLRMKLKDGKIEIHEIEL